MAFWSEQFKKPDEEDIWEELKKMITNPPSEQEIAQKKREEQAWIDSILDKAFPETPKPQSEPYLTYEDLLLPEDAEKYRQKQMAQKQASLNNNSNVTGFGAPIGQNNQSQSAGDVKVQQTFAKPTNLVNTNNNLVQDINTVQKKPLSFPDLGSAKSQQKIPQQVNNASLKNSQLSNMAKQSYPESTVVLQGGVEKSNLNFSEKVLDKLIQNKNIAKIYPIASDMYTDARTDFSRARANKNATVLEDMSSLDPRTIDALKKYGVNFNERGVYHNENSDVSKNFGKSRELKRAFDKNLESIKRGNFKGDDLNFDAKISDVFLNKNRFDRHSSIQHAKLIDAYIDENGKKHGRFIDDYDFNKRPDTLKNLPNNHGYNLQEKSELENFFTVMDVIIEDEEKKEKLLDKIMKKMQ